MITYPNRYSTLPLIMDAIKAGIPAYPKKIDTNKWIVEYDPKDMLLKDDNDYISNR